MRLLSVKNRSLVDVPVNETTETKYAILSHRWRSQEVLFEDIINNSAHRKEGFRKLNLSCQQAERDKYEYLWIDSCCIDKSSSAELSEAINSMYLWYQRAEVCYAYLDDVSSFLGDSKLNSRSFADSEWFTRGWTLQELIAPSQVIFYSKDWSELGDKSSLSETISRITGIDKLVLTGSVSVEAISIAQRMSWAANRQTSRPEDLAYCLMGIFLVNMPMLYGEGERAFLRLQEEIMKHSDDHSLFAWTNKYQDEDSLHGLLAASPASFKASKSIVSYLDQQQHEPFSMSNRGLQVKLHLTRIEGDLYVAALDCPVPPDYNDSTFLGIYLKKLSPEGEQFARTKLGAFAELKHRGNLQTVFIRQSGLRLTHHGIYPRHVFQLRKGPDPSQVYKFVRILEADSGKPSPAPLRSSRTTRMWFPEGAGYTFLIPKKPDYLVTSIEFEREDGQRLLVMLGSLSALNVAFDAIEISGPEKDARDIFSMLQSYFDPQSPGMSLILEHHRVRVTAEAQVYLNTKYYLVDIEVEAIDNTQTSMEVLQYGIKRTVARIVAAPDIPSHQNSYDTAGHGRDSETRGKRFMHKFINSSRKPNKS